MAPVSVSGHPIINASGSWATNNGFKYSGTAIDNIPTPLARAPNPVNIAPPAYLCEPQINNRCPSLYLCVTAGRGRGSAERAVCLVMR